MKRTWLTVALVLTIGFMGYQIAEAGPGWGGGYGCQNYGGPGGGQALDEESIAKRDKFFEETTELRKELSVKQAELGALMSQENPDEKKVASLTGDVFDLRNQLRTKANESGIQRGFGGSNFCDGPGCGGPGKGRGYGRRGYGPRGW